jgi:hypothetical protein
MAMNIYSTGRHRLGFGGSIRLAFKIVAGSFRLLRRYPIIVVPLLPVAAMVLGLSVALLFMPPLWLALPAIYAVAFALMFSFAISGNLLLQAHEGRRPSLLRAVSSPALLRMIPRVLLLATGWYVLVFILTAIEMAINALLSRISDDLADGVTRAIFGTIGDALRMAGFMLITIMTFEDLGLGRATGRLKALIAESPITSLAGLTLTKLASAAIFALLFGLTTLLAGIDSNVAGLAFIGLLGLSILGWVLAIYLEQLFVTGLYLYAAVPESPLVGILLGSVVGDQLPPLPAPDLAVPAV